jgi:hypothetical protein
VKKLPPQLLNNFALSPAQIRSSRNSVSAKQPIITEKLGAELKVPETTQKNRISTGIDDQQIEGLKARYSRLPTSESPNDGIQAILSGGKPLPILVKDELKAKNSISTPDLVSPLKKDVSENRKSVVDPKRLSTNSSSFSDSVESSKGHDIIQEMMKRNIVSPTADLESDEDLRTVVIEKDIPAIEDVKYGGFVSIKHENNSKLIIKGWKTFYAEVSNGFFFLYKDIPNRKVVLG